jgi:hypothetical protein
VTEREKVLMILTLGRHSQAPSEVDLSKIILAAVSYFFTLFYAAYNDFQQSVYLE